MTDELMEDPLPYWIETPPEPQHCLLCHALDVVPCVCESRRKDIRAGRSVGRTQHFFSLCRPCLSRAYARRKLIETVLEMKHR
jgi:hypothetical protein